MSKTITIDEMSALVGHELEPSSWLEITQERVDRFADATNDHQYIHIDPERAATTPFGGTIAHGFLTLALVPYLTAENARLPEGLVMGVNFGSDKVRFMQPVRVGSRIRARQVVLEFAEKKPNQFLLRTRVTIEIENSKMPAMVAELLGLLMTTDPTF